MFLDFIVSIIVSILFRKIGFSVNISSLAGIHTFFILILECSFTEWIGGLGVVLLVGLFYWAITDDCCCH